MLNLIVFGVAVDRIIILIAFGVVALAVYRALIPARNPARAAIVVFYLSLGATEILWVFSLLNLINAAFITDHQEEANWGPAYATIAGVFSIVPAIIALIAFALGWKQMSRATLIDAILMAVGIGVVMVIAKYV